jgi:hypothetical protein
MENLKQCPYCAEDIRSDAIVCRFCRTDLLSQSKEKTGKYVKVRIKTGDQVYTGELFVPDYLQRMSDVLNDRKSFVILINTIEENKIRDLPIGFIAINKNRIEWIRLAESQRPAEGASFVARSAP